MGHHDAALGQDQLDVTQAQAEDVIQPHGVADDLGRKPVPGIGRGFECHAVSLARPSSQRQPWLTWQCLHKALAKRIEFMSARFPSDDTAVTTIFECAQRHTVFRNTVAHSPLAITGHTDGSFNIQGLLNIPKRGQPALVTIAELKGRVNETVALANCVS